MRTSNKVKKSTPGGQKAFIELGGFGPREMARLTVWSVNKASCFVCVLKRERNMGYLFASTRLLHQSES